MVMGHSGYRTTVRSYTGLGLSDTAAAVHALPPPTGGTAEPKTNPHHQPHHSGDETVLSSASGCEQTSPTRSVKDTRLQRVSRLFARAREWRRQPDSNR